MVPRPNLPSPVEGSMAFFLNSKEVAAGDTWINEHKRSKCRLVSPLFTWCFTPMHRRGTTSEFAISVRCECGALQYLTKAPPEVLSKMMKDIATTVPSVDPFVAFSARQAAKTSGAVRGRRKNQTGKGRFEVVIPPHGGVTVP